MIRSRGIFSAIAISACLLLNACQSTQVTVVQQDRSGEVPLQKIVIVSSFTAPERNQITEKLYQEALEARGVETLIPGGESRSGTALLEYLISNGADALLVISPGRETTVSAESGTKESRQVKRWSPMTGCDPPQTEMRYVDYQGGTSADLRENDYPDLLEVTSALVDPESKKEIWVGFARTRGGGKRLFSSIIEEQASLVILRMTEANLIPLRGTK